MMISIFNLSKSDIFQLITKLNTACPLCRYILQRSSYHPGGMGVSASVGGSGGGGGSIGLGGEKITQGQIRLLDMDLHVRKELGQFVSHACSKSCVQKWECTVSRVKHVNPLLMPQFHGWQRLLLCQSKTINSASKKTINYLAPCGRMLRSSAEVDRYLVLTDSRLTIDTFSFDAAVLSNREFEANARFLKIDDIACARERVPISCVNCVDHSRPDDFEYLAKRAPLDGVPLRPPAHYHAQLEGCQCVDNCRDKLKCSCWRKTFEATKLFGDDEDADTDVGYRNRR